MLPLKLAVLSVIALSMSEDFERHLKEIVQSSAPVTGEIGRYILDSGGKRLRPRLVALVGSSIGLAPEVFMPLAYTVELMHTASLLHDDVVDGTEIRRSKPTANQVFGDKPALLTGDFISASAMEIICTLGNMRLALQMVQTIKKMAEGELKELEHANSFHDNLDIYLDVIYLKTACLFEFCTLSPGILADISDGALDALSSFGRLIGMGFQIVDDIINVSPNQGDNKDAFNDILEGKSTLPLVILFRHRPEVLREVALLTDPIQKKDFLVSNITPVILQESRDVAQDYLERSLQSIQSTGYLTEELSAIPHQIISQLGGRF